MSDQPRADAVRYQDPRAERHVRRYIKPPVHPPRVMLADGTVAPQSAIRAYAPLCGPGQRTYYIDCSNEAATATLNAAEINARVQWQPPETIEVHGRSITFERGWLRKPEPQPAGGSADSTAILPAIRSGQER